MLDTWGIIILSSFASIWRFTTKGLKKKTEGKHWDQSIQKNHTPMLNMHWVQECKKMSNTHERIHAFLGKTTIKIKKNIRRQEIISLRTYIACNRKLKPIKFRINSLSSISLQWFYIWVFTKSERLVQSVWENRKRNLSNLFVKLDMLMYKIDNKF